MLVYYDEAKTLLMRKATFEKGGDSIRLRWYRFHDSIFREYYRMVQIVNTEGNLIREKTFNVMDGVVMPLDIVEYETEASGNMTRGRRYRDGDLTGTVGYEYDTKTNASLALPEYTILKTSKNNVVRHTYTDKDAR